MADVSTGHSIKSTPIEDVQRGLKASTPNSNFADILGETWGSAASSKDLGKLNPAVGSEASQILKGNPFGPEGDAKPTGPDTRIPTEVKGPLQTNYIDDHGFHTGDPAPPNPDQRLDTEHKSPKDEPWLHKGDALSPKKRDPIIDEPEPTPDPWDVHKPVPKPDPLQKGPHTTS